MRPVEYLQENPVARINEWAYLNGIKDVFLDMDDTICLTSPTFDAKNLEAAHFLARHLNLPTHDQLLHDFIEVDKSLFEAYGVATSRVGVVVAELQQMYFFDEEASDVANNILNSIYTTPLEFLDGAEQGLSILKATDLNLHVLTHADDDWTWRKYMWLGLDRFFNREDIYIVDARGHKTKESWRAGLEFYGATPDTSATIGDSPRSDINPSLDIGVKHCFLVEKQNIWSPHNHAITRDIYRIGRLDQIADVIGQK